MQVIKQEQGSNEIVKRGEPDSPKDIGAASSEEINHSVEEM
jgi:hypothetical protein